MTSGMTKSEIDKERSLQQFIDIKKKEVTGKKVSLQIVVFNDIEESARMTLVGNVKKGRYHFDLEIRRDILNEYGINQLKQIILHELAHIPSIVSNESGTTHHSPHGNEFKKMARKLGVPKALILSRLKHEKW